MSYRRCESKDAGLGDRLSKNPHWRRLTPSGWLGLFSIFSILWVPPLVLDNRDPETICSDPPEINDIREAPHHAPTNIS
jgi:hypothetical protein